MKLNLLSNPESGLEDNKMIESRRDLEKEAAEDAAINENWSSGHNPLKKSIMTLLHETFKDTEWKQYSFKEMRAITEETILKNCSGTTYSNVAGKVITTLNRNTTPEAFLISLANKLFEVS